MESNETGLNPVTKFIPAAFALIMAAAFYSCSTPKVAPYADVVEMPTAELAKGRELFSHHCTTCHPGGKAGLAPGIIDKPLPEALIRFQIRNGLGVMPAFDEEILADEEVEAIAKYLVYLRESN